MKKLAMRRLAAILLLIFILGTFSVSVIAAFMGYSAFAVALMAFNMFFSVVVFFLLKYNQAIKSSLEDKS